MEVKVDYIKWKNFNVENLCFYLWQKHFGRNDFNCTHVVEEEMPLDFNHALSEETLCNIELFGL